MMANKAKISPNMAIEVRHNFVTRLRSIGTPRKEIERLDWYLGTAMGDVNDLADQDRRFNRKTRSDISFRL